MIVGICRSKMTIEEQNIFLSRKPKEFWTKVEKRHNLKDCECGATQDGNSVVVVYAGRGDSGAWNVRCRSCGKRVSAKTEREAVDKWNGGDAFG